VLECGGAFLMPGFHDAHTHFCRGGEYLETIRAGAFNDGAELLEEVRRRADGKREELERARARSAKEPPPRSCWVRGFGLDPAVWNLGIADLDAAGGEVPVVVETHDLHSGLCNSAALALAGLGPQSPDPPGGRILRDERGGLSGILCEQALDPVLGCIPEASAEELRRAILTAQELALGLGLTAVDENLSPASLPVYRSLEEEGLLKLRLHCWLNEGYLAKGLLDHERVGTPRITVDTLKLFADGALGSRSCAMREDFLGGRGRGYFVSDPEELRGRMLAAIDKGWRLAVHAIGDRAVGQVLDFFAEFQAAGLPVRGLRHRIEHAQFVAPEDLRRFAELEILPGVQPLHCAADQDFFEGLVSPAQRKIAYPWASFAEQGLPLPIGTDWPIENLDPRLNLYHGVTRSSHQGRRLIGTREALSVDRLLRGMTADAARAAGWSDRLGRIAEGYLADLVLLERDPAELPAGELLSLKILAVFSEGELVYQDPAWRGADGNV